MTDGEPGAADLATLAGFVSEFDAANLSAPLLAVVRACLLYGLSVGVATVRVTAATLIGDALDRGGAGGGPSTRLLDGAQLPGGDAALANAVLLSGRAQGDSHPAGHLGGVVIPTALAAAQLYGSSGADLLSALVVGYEAGLRIGRDHGTELSSRGFRTTPTYGVFAAAAVTARLASLDARASASALSLSANLASGLREYVNAGTEESPLQAGFAARNGFTAGLLAAAGVAAAPSALHGPAGFFTAYGGADSDHGRRLLEGLGSQFEFPTVTYKPYPACQFLRGLIAGMARLREQSRAGADVRRIEVRLNPYEADFVGVRYAGPFSSPAQTVMSAPFCAALAWVSGTASYAGMRTYDDPQVNALVPLVEIVGDPTLQRYQTRLRVEFVETQPLTLADDSDETGYWMNWPAAVEMAYQLAAEVGVDVSLTDRLVAACAAIELATDVSEVLDAARASIDAARAITR